MAVEIIYHVLVLILAVMWFFMKITYTGGAFLELIIKVLSKILPIFMIGYALVQIFKLTGIL